MITWRRFVLPGLALYAGVLSLFTVWLLLNPDTVHALRWRLGLSPYDAVSYKGELHKYHQDQLAFAQKFDIVLLGDSHMQRMHATTLHPHAINLGIGGLRSDELIENLAAYDRLGEADHIIVSIGQNDLGQSNPKEFEVRFATLHRLLSEVGTPWVLLEIMPVDPSQTQVVTNQEIADANMRLRSVCVTPCQFIKTWDMLTDEAGNLDAAYHEGDGQHLNEEGYALLIGRLQTLLGEARQR